ncbi:hypothetical protein AMATHDRAFT_54553 [Amanita thiersii Skay4041]|uniref:Clp1-like protein n=1 Tax=Amanita thiersii Skay4041 TaxID=703135 RepID=A0A2A9NY91_9AGAR|nr:hypothetical protein AMATHDRAFT_54553 [Amanita thiersii Skay4041]
MVLRSNFAKNENVPPTPPSKLSISRLRSCLQDATRKRHARDPEAQRSRKYAIEQAKRRSTKTAGTLRLPVKLTSSRPLPTIQDVEMKDADPVLSSPGSASPNIVKFLPILLPKELARPEYCEVSKDAIRAVEPDLTDVHPDYIREQLVTFGPAWLQVVSSVRANSVKDSLPTELTIVVHDLSAALPTHMLAVYGPLPKQNPSARRRVTLYPAHSLIFAAHCAKLPPFSPVLLPAREAEGDVPQEVTVPIQPLLLPSPQTYALLTAFLYTKRVDVLLRTLMPPGCPLPLKLEDKSQTALQSFAARLAGTYTPQMLLQQTMTVQGLWQNVCALGVFDDELWDTMDLAWKVLLTAISISTGNPRAMGIKPESDATGGPKKARAQSAGL